MQMKNEALTYLLCLRCQLHHYSILLKIAQDISIVGLEENDQKKIHFLFWLVYRGTVSNSLLEANIPIYRWTNCHEVYDFLTEDIICIGDAEFASLPCQVSLTWLREAIMW